VNDMIRWDLGTEAMRVGVKCEKVEGGLRGVPAGSESSSMAATAIGE